MSLLPTLPQATVDTTYDKPTGGTLHTPANASALSTLLANPNTTLQRGDVIQLTNGVDYGGPYTWPNVTTVRGGASNDWIYVVSSAELVLPAPDGDQWIETSDAANMPKLTHGTGVGENIVAASAQKWRFVGIETRKSNDADYVATLWNTGTTSPSNEVDGLIFDRCYFHGYSAYASPRTGVILNAKNSAIIQSRFDELKDTSEGKGILITRSSGPIKIHRNWISATSMPYLIGGEDMPAIWDPEIPSDITITRNYMENPPAYLNDTGPTWRYKNGGELKYGRRVLIEGNEIKFTAAGTDGQLGAPLVVTVRNQSGGMDWARIEDVTFRYNMCSEVGAMMSLLSPDTIASSGVLKRLNIHDNVFLMDERSSAGASDPNRMISMNCPGGLGWSAPTEDVIINHNHIIFTNGTGATSSPTTFVYWSVQNDANLMKDFTYTNNLITGGYGFRSEGPPITQNFNNIISGAHTGTTVFEYNAISGESSGNFPANNFFPANRAAFDMVDYQPDGTGDYRLAGTSPYKSAGNDGKDLGADIDLLAQALAGTLPEPEPSDPDEPVFYNF